MHLGFHFLNPGRSLRGESKETTEQRVLDEEREKHRKKKTKERKEKKRKGKEKKRRVSQG
ncbi:hypothetical protein K450DRAFT_226068 [Umbelopsis ramanniana AG]|uniref:Uncharacterized protein n=1 Tax=Umbelopsis ramanniana AG TaxID=1314678 RepID=A0AAD5EG51_UMBRA|nr:uncharacterized protein K450DRAFT_226068 [Umbelopsis ramanniana AG]KAI8582604.1 hypothetical protein K450DRAFT_226068 [Umbelopsis ramanniana AG]